MPAIDVVVFVGAAAFVGATVLRTSEYLFLNKAHKTLGRFHLNMGFVGSEIQFLFPGNTIVSFAHNCSWHPKQFLQSMMLYNHLRSVGEQGFVFSLRLFLLLEAIVCRYTTSVGVIITSIQSLGSYSRLNPFYTWHHAQNWFQCQPLFLSTE
jgi:hypothetical protein